MAETGEYGLHDASTILPLHNSGKQCDKPEVLLVEAAVAEKLVVRFIRLAVKSVVLVALPKALVLLKW
jgi:hypothetical protein